MILSRFWSGNAAVLLTLLHTAVCQENGLRGLVWTPPKVKRFCKGNIPSSIDDPSVEPEKVLSFFVMGDTPYTTFDRYCLNHQLRELDLTSSDGADFIVHVGDIKQTGKDYPCDDEAYNDIAEIFSNPSNALSYDPRDCLFIVGDTEWMNCGDKEEDEEGFSKWIANFGPNNENGFGTLSDGTIVERHTDAERLPGVDRWENFAFFKCNVLVMSVNIVGGKEYGDAELRLGQNLEWTKRQFQTYKAQGMGAAVIFGHSFLKAGFRMEYYGNELTRLLREEYPDIPTMYVHGSGHEYCLRNMDPENLNFAALMVDEGMFAPPIKVSVLKHPTGEQYKFELDRRGGPYMNGRCPIDDSIEKTWDTPGMPTDPLPYEAPALSPTPPATGQEPAPAPADPNVPVPPPLAEQDYGPPLWIDDQTPKDLALMGKKHWPFGPCEGNCKSNTDCQTGLLCMFSRKPVSVPGCLGMGKKRRGYCYIDPRYEITPIEPPAESPATPAAGETPIAPAPAEETAPGEPPLEEAPAEAPSGEDTGDLPSSEYNVVTDKSIFGICEGECESDTECEGELLCFERRKNEAVPGCEGEAPRGTNFCFHREPNSLVVFGKPDKAADINRYPLGKCEGECEEDSHCLEGLVCDKNRKSQVVAGCSGVKGGKRNYCYDPNEVVG